MKKEASKKNKLGLWLAIGLAAALVVAGAVLGIVLLGGQGSKVVDDGRPDLYWNLDRSAYVEQGALSSSREKAEDGLYHIRFAFDGEVVEATTADKQLVNYIDTMNVMGLVFDSDGYVVDAVAVKEVATVIAEDVYVQSVAGGTININSSVVMNGMKKTLELAELTEIYDVTAKAEVAGQITAVEDLDIMDKLCVYGDAAGNLTHIFVASHPRESKVYWRANQFTSGGKTTRVPDENGYYTIPFWCEGERVEFKCKDVVEVNYIDKQSYYSCHFGLVFDDEGYITEAIHSYEAIRGIVRSERFDVTAIDGNKVSTTKIIGSNAGTTDTFTIDENVKIYDVSLAAESEGRMGQPVDSLSVGDRIVCFADAEGKTLFVYVAEHVVEEAIWCYNMERKYDSTKKETKREPDADGWYTVKVFAEGSVRYVKTRDLAIVNAMDSVGAAVFGLTLEGNVVKHVYSVRSVFGYTHFGQGRYITSVSGSIFSCFKTSAPEKLITGIMAPDCKIWNLSPVGTYGEETKLQYGDYIYAYQTPDLTIQQIFVMKRIANYPVYYGTERMYNATLKETTRKPDADGWYVYTVSYNGKLTTVKTQSKAMANKMDAINPAAMALRVDSNGVVYDAYEARLAYGGYRRAHGYTVVSIQGKTVETQYKNADGTIATRVLTLSDECKTLNVTTLAATFGEYTTVRVGDVITAFTDIYDETMLLAVRNRKTDNLYWNSLKLYDDDKGVSLREPDADGWYVYTLACNGKAVTLKTKDQKIADKVDYYGGAFTLNVKDGVILAVGSPSYAKNTNGSSLLNYDVVKVSGNKVTLKYNQQGSAKDGETQTITLASNVKIYEVGPDAGTFAAETKLQVGDRVRAYKSDKNDTYTYVFIRFRDSRDKGVDGYCDVCKKNVYWTPWVGGSFSTAGGHFYLPADIETTYLPCSTGRSSFPTCTVCLDLNGHTYNRTKGRAMYVYENATLNIMDSVGGGTVISAGIVNGTSGGVIGIPGGTVNLYSGTLKLSEDHVPQERAGVVYITVGGGQKTPGTFNMYGGTLTGGEVTDRGGNVAINGGVFNLYDGVIENGKAEKRGGNIVTMSNGIFNMCGGTVTGGSVTAGSGGNIYGGIGYVTISGGTVSGGISKEGGGNIYMLEALGISGGIITGGVSLEKSGGNIYLDDYSDNSVLAMTGGEVTNGTSAGYGGNIYAEVAALLSDAVITDGKAADGGNLYINKETTISGCTISGGVTTAAKGSGGNIYAGGNKVVLENSTITGGISGARGGNIYSAGAEIVMLSGTLSDGVSGLGNANGGGNICTVSNGVFYLVDGTVSGGVSANTGGNILSGSGGLQILGGTVKGGTAPKAGADIYVYGGATDVVLCGGNVGIMEIAAVNSLVMAEKPVFENLIFGGGVVADIAQLDKEAKIPLTAAGVITTALEAPEDYMGCFMPVEEGYALYVDGDALAMGAGVKTQLCAHCNKTVNWQLWNGTSTDGHYYLNAQMDMTAETKIPAGNTLVLNLEGNTLMSTGSRVFNVQGGLAILDSVSGGEVVGSYAGSDNGGVIYVDAGKFDLYGGLVRYNESAAGAKRGGVLYVQGASVVNLRGGVMAGGKTTERGGNIYVGGGELNLCGATVQDGTATSSNANGGGNIYMLGGSVVTMTAGKVIGGTTTKTGGNICVGTATFIMEGGEISGGNSDGEGPDLYVYYSGSNADIRGGTIASLTYKDAASFKLSGTPVIGELDIADGKIVELGELTTGADIKVKASGVFTTENENAQIFAESLYVTAADAGKKITVEDNKLAVTAIPALPEGATQAPCAHCDGENAIWYKWDGVTTNGHFYLDANVEQTQADGILIPEDDTLVLDLAGKKIVGDKVRAFDVRGSFSVLDSVGGGEIVTGGNTAKNYLGGVIRARKGTVTLYNGTLRLADDHSTTIQRGGVIYVDADAHVTIKGGTVMNGVTTERGGNIYVVGGNTAGGGLTVEGGLITKGTAGTGNTNGGGNIAVLTGSTVEIKGGVVSNGYSPKTAGNILASGNLIISGGEIFGGEAVGIAQNILVFNNSGDVTVTGGTIESLTANKPKSLTISGAPVIGELELMNGQKMTLGALEENADILVKANGIFTEANPNAEAYVTAGYITPCQHHKIVAENNQLSSVYVGEGYCEHCEKTVQWSAWDGTADSGHFYLAETKSPTAVFTVKTGSALVLDLNGYKVNNTKSRTFLVNGELAVMDSVGCGEIVGSQAGDSMQGGVIRIRGGRFDLYNGTVRYNPDAAGAKEGGVIYVQRLDTVGGSANIFGGMVTGGKVSGNGGNVYVSKDCSFKMTGGKIVGGSAEESAPDVYLTENNRTELTGGTIGTLSYDNAESFTVSGNPVIGKLEIAAGKLVTLGDLTEDADITVDGEGVFTIANAKAAEFVAANRIKAVEGKALSEESGVLSVTAPAQSISLFTKFMEVLL